MQYQKLGNSNLTVSAVAFGCMSLKGGEGHDIKLLQSAKDSGISFFDTADLYDKGANETLVGKAFRHGREQVIIATKVGNQWRPDGSGWEWNPSKAYILKAVEESLRRLQTDYIDLYQLHGGTIEDSIEETIEAFELLKQQGKIRHYGISSIRPNVIRRWMEIAKPASIMLQYSLLDRRAEETILPLLTKKNTGVLVRGALAQGLLLNKASKEYLGHSNEAVANAAATLAENAAPLSAEAAAIAFVRQQQAVSSVVCGIRTASHLSAAINAAEAQLLPAQYRKIAAAVPARRYTEHR